MPDQSEPVTSTAAHVNALLSAVTTWITSKLPPSVIASVGSPERPTREVTPEPARQTETAASIADETPEEPAISQGDPVTPAAVPPHVQSPPVTWKERQFLDGFTDWLPMSVGQVGRNAGLGPKTSVDMAFNLWRLGYIASYTPGTSFDYGSHVWRTGKQPPDIA